MRCPIRSPKRWATAVAHIVLTNQRPTPPLVFVFIGLDRLTIVQLSEVLAPLRPLAFRLCVRSLDVERLSHECAPEQPSNLLR